MAAARKPKPSPKLTAARRAKLPASSFGLPGQKAYPLDTPGRARDALGRAKANATPAQQAQIRSRAAARYPSIKVTGKPMASRSKRSGKTRSK